MAVKFRKVTVVDHPVLQHMLTEARDRITPPPRFRELLRQIGAMLAYEATRKLDTVTVTYHTPMEKTTGKRLKPPVTIVPILRAGLGLAEGIHGVLPEARMGHIGMFRDEKSLTPVSYYERLPANIADGPVILVDPMLATGGSAAAALSRLVQRGCKDLCLIALVAAPQGVRTVRQSHRDVPIVLAALDRGLNEHGYILPGLGDAGDRLFGTEV
jgi:uracil phosphoribosyltransferase